MHEIKFFSYDIIVFHRHTIDHLRVASANFVSLVEEDKENVK